MNLHPISVCSIFFWVSMGLGSLPKKKKTKNTFNFSVMCHQQYIFRYDKNYFCICFNVLENGKLKIIQPLGTFFFLNGFGLFNLLLNGNLVLIWILSKKKFELWLINSTNSCLGNFPKELHFPLWKTNIYLWFFLSQ